MPAWPFVRRKQKRRANRRSIWECLFCSKLLSWIRRSWGYISDKDVFRTKKVTYPFEPPKVRCYEDIQALRAGLIGAVIIAVDMEFVDHVRGRPRAEKVSELGIARFTFTQDMFDQGDASHQIESYHLIVEEWRHISAETCPAKWHKEKDIPHVANPNICVVADSSLTSSKDLGKVFEGYLLPLTSIDRRVIVLCWDATAEASVVKEWGVDLDTLGIELWDVQLWLPIRAHFRDRLRARASYFYEAIGINTSGLNGMDLEHNAGNDAWLLAIGFSRLLLLQPEDWRSWLRGSLQLPLIYLSRWKSPR